MDYVNKFHNLGGNTQGEHYKNFNEFLKTITKLNATEITTILENIKPKNQQEAIFQIKLLSKYGHYEALTAILLTGNKYLNKKLTRNLQLIKYITYNYPPEEFVDKLCPEISYVTRVNIINKLPLVLIESSLAQEYFNKILEKYGIKLASVLLPCCGDYFIKSIFNKYNFKLRDKQLIRLHKYPTIAENLDKEFFNLSKYRKFAQYLAINDVSTFAKLIQTGIPKIGRKGAYNFIRNYKKEFINNAQKYKAFTRPRNVYKILNRLEYRDFIANLLPENFILDYYLTKYLKAIPLKLRAKLFFEAYEQKYDCSCNLDAELLGILNCKLELETKFPEYLPINKSIDLIKKRIELTENIKMKSKLIAKLVKTCKVNDDRIALLEVLKYYNEKFKNETVEVRQPFATCLVEEFQIELLSENHWNCIRELVINFEINDAFWVIYKFYNKWIHYNYLNNLDWLPVLKMYLKNPVVYGCNVARDIPELERACLIKVGELLYDYVYSNNSSDFILDLIPAFLISILDFNKRNKNQLSLLKYSRFLKELFKIFKQRRHWQEGILLKLMTSIPENEEEIDLMNELYKEYFEFKSNISCNYILMWLLKNKPDLIATYADACFDFKLNSIFYYEISKMHYNSLGGKFKEIALAIVNNNLTLQIEPALIFLSFGDQYLEYLDKYQPTNYNIDIYEDNIKESLDVQRSILKSLCLTPISSKGIFKILPYCKGDYFQYAFKALCVALYNMPQKLIEEPLKILFVDEQSEKILQLVAVLRTSQDINKLFIKVNQIRFKTIFKIFLNHPKIFWNLLIEHIKLIKANDIESWKLLMKIHLIPKYYRQEYIEIIWNHSEKKHEVVPIIKLDIWNQFPKEFREEVLNSILFVNQNEATVNLLYEHLINYYVNLSIIYNKVTEDQQMYELLKNICWKLIQNTQRKPQTLELSRKLTKSIAEVPIKTHKYRLELLFESTYYFLRIKDNFLDSILEFLLKKQLEAINRFGIDITTMYRDFAAEFLKVVLSNMVTSELRIEFLLLEAAAKISDASDDLHAKLLAFHLIPKMEFKNKDFIKKRKEVVDGILKNCNEMVLIHVANSYYLENI